MDFLLSYKFLLPVGVVLIVLYSSQRENNFIRIQGIFKEYIGLFNKSILQIAFFFGVPLLFGISFSQLCGIEESTFETMYVVVSILITMFFSVLTMLTSENAAKSIEYTKVQAETVHCILFEIIISIFILGYGFVFQMLLELLPKEIILVGTIIFYYLLFFLFLNLLIIVKRFKILNDTK